MSCRFNSLGDMQSLKLLFTPDYSAIESVAVVSLAVVSQVVVSSATSTVAVVSTVVVSVLVGCLGSQATNVTDAVRAMAATAAKTNFFIIFFYF